MKKIIKVLFISVVATLIALSLLACTGSKPEEIPGVINGSSGSGNYANDSAYGSNPDLDNVIIDGFLEDIAGFKIIESGRSGAIAMERGEVAYEL